MTGNLPGAGYITTVKTLAATSIVTADWNRWTKKHGKLFACGSDRVFLKYVTQEVRDAVEKQILASRLVRIDWGSHTIETLRRVAAIVEGRSTKPPAHAHTDQCSTSRCYPRGEDNHADWDKLRDTVEALTDEELELCGLQRIEAFEERAQIMDDMRANGATLLEIATRFGITKQRVHEILGTGS